MGSYRLLKAFTLGSALLTSAMPSFAASYVFEQLTGSGGGWEATAINNSGLVAGSAADPIGYAIQAAVWSDGNSSLLERVASSSRALAINSQGQVAGYVFTPTSGQTAAVWSRGTETLLARTADTTSQYATGINNGSVVVGNRSVDFERTVQAVTWQNYDVTPLNMLGATSSYATGVNNLGQISGYLDYVNGSSTQTQAVVWNGDQATLLAGVGGATCCTRAFAINDGGVSVGESFDDNGVSLPVYWQASGMANLLAAPANGARVLGVNNSGQAVGKGLVGPAGRALLWDLATGQYTDLNSFLTPDDIAAGWSLNSAVAINDLGDIIGIAYNTKQASFRPFELLAVPEPATGGYMLLGLIALVGMRQRTAKRELRVSPPPQSA